MQGIAKVAKVPFKNLAILKANHNSFRFYTHKPEVILKVCIENP